MGARAGVVYGFVHLTTCPCTSPSKHYGDDMKIKCDSCGKMVYKTSLQIRKYNHHFCSKRCYFDYRAKHNLWNKIKIPQIHLNNLKKWRLEVIKYNEKRR